MDSPAAFTAFTTPVFRVEGLFLTGLACTSFRTVDLSNSGSLVWTKLLQRERALEQELIPLAIITAVVSSMQFLVMCDTTDFNPNPIPSKTM